MDTAVENVFNSYPTNHREALLKIRGLIYQVASKIPEVGELEESLKWGQPSYATTAKAGSPIRLDRFGTDQIALLFHCQSSLVSDCKELFPNRLAFSKTGPSSSILARIFP